MSADPICHVVNEQNATPRELSMAQVIAFLVDKFCAGRLVIDPAEFNAFAQKGVTLIHWMDQNHAEFRLVTPDEGVAMQKFLEMPSGGTQAN